MIRGRALFEILKSSALARSTILAQSDAQVVSSHHPQPSSTGKIGPAITYLYVLSTYYCTYLLFGNEWITSPGFEKRFQFPENMIFFQPS